MEFISFLFFCFFSKMNFRNVINLLNRCVFEHSLCVLELFVDVHKTGFPALSKQTVS